MSALTANASRSCRSRRAKIIGYPVKASTVVYDASMVAIDANGLAVPAADAAGIKVVGCAQRGYDNSTGAAGTLGATNARFCEVDLGEYSYVAQGTPKANLVAYVVDDNTVSTATGTNSIVAGLFTEPDPRDSTKWFVDHTRKAQ